MIGKTGTVSGLLIFMMSAIRSSIAIQGSLVPYSSNVSVSRKNEQLRIGMQAIMQWRLIVVQRCTATDTVPTVY